jgi:hypothetical protein
MKAIVQSEYGAPDEALELRNIDRPVVKDDEMLVRVRGFRQSLGLALHERPAIHHAPAIRAA